MRQKIKNTVYITVEGVDLTTISSIEVYIKQRWVGGIFLQYTPVVVNANTMYIDIPKTDADRLAVWDVEMQFAFTYPDGAHGASDICRTTVAELLKEDGYEPN